MRVEKSMRVCRPKTTNAEKMEKLERRDREEERVVEVEPEDYIEENEVDLLSEDDDFVWSSLPDPQFSSVQCPICFCIVPKDMMWSCSECPAHCHKQCVGNMWKTLTGSRRMSPDCPNCMKAVSDEEVVDVLGMRGLRRIQYFRNVRDYGGDKNVLFCTKDGCWDLLMKPKALPNGEPQVVECPCGQKHCSVCEQQWHPGRACILPKDSSAGLPTRLWKLAHTKPCPGCGAAIQKIEGCKHMNCSHCGLYFCWFCRGYLAMGSLNRHSRKSLNRRSSKPLRRCVCDTARAGIMLGGIVIMSVVLFPFAVAGVCVIAPVYGVCRATQAVIDRKRNSHDSDIYIGDWREVTLEEKKPIKTSDLRKIRINQTLGRSRSHY